MSIYNSEHAQSSLANQISHSRSQYNELDLFAWKEIETCEKSGVDVEVSNPLPNDQKLLMNFKACALYMKPEPGFSGFLVPVAE